VTPGTVTAGTGPAVPDPNVAPVVAVEPAGEFSQPVDLAGRPGDPALYVVEQAGTVVRAEAGRAAVVLDVSDLTDSTGEQGLLGLAFHPSEPLAYVNYTTADAGDTVVAEYAVGEDGTFDPASARTVLTLDQPYRNHNGGGLAFGPDGYLYIGTGDGGSGGDPERRASDATDLLGKLLRIDPRTDPATGDPYAVPDDNPFADGAAGAPEVWAIGLRNPWRFGFDAPTGDLWIADVGQNEIEEVNRVTPADGRTAGFAADFGWSAFEGTERFNEDVPEPAAHQVPVLTYTHADAGGCSVSGGLVYRGTAVPDLAGWYLYSDYCAGVLWALDVAGGRNIVLAEGLGQVTAVRAGPDGEAYVLDHSGEVRRVVPA
jgi:glucose/arabinose dehydrogenase